MIKFILVFCFLIPLTSVGNRTNDSTHTVLKKNSPVYFSCGYRMPVYTGNIINSGRGLFVEGGLNAGQKLFKKTNVSLYLGWAWRDNLWSTHFNDAFVNEYEAAINTEYSAAAPDSAIISASPEIFASKRGRSVNSPGCEMKSFIIILCIMAYF